MKARFSSVNWRTGEPSWPFSETWKAWLAEAETQRPFLRRRICPDADPIRTVLSGYEFIAKFRHSK
jgi:hypothetical protein